MYNKLVARKILNKQNFKFRFPKKISWNTFSFLGKRLEKIPKGLILAVLFFLSSFILLNSEKRSNDQKVLGLQTQLKTEQQKIFQWEQILAEKPDYRDGWIQLAAAYYQIGNKSKAKEAIQKAKSVDSINEVVLSFEKFLEDQ